MGLDRGKWIIKYFGVQTECSAGLNKGRGPDRGVVVSNCTKSVFMQLNCLLFFISDETERYITPEHLTEKMAVCSSGEKPLILIYMMKVLHYKGVLCFTGSIEATHRYALLKFRYITLEYLTGKRAICSSCEKPLISIYMIKVSSVLLDLLKQFLVVFTSNSDIYYP